MELPESGHINVPAGFGPWPEGWALLQELRAAPPPDESLPPWLASDDALDAFLDAFRRGTFPLRWWTHGAHVAMAACVLWETPMPRALDQVREDIKRYNVSQGRQNTETSGYHETLTRLWLGVVAAALSALPGETGRLEATRRTYRAFAQRSSLFRDWYAFDLIQSVEARRAWVPPDGELARMFGAE